MCKETWETQVPHLGARCTDSFQAGHVLVLFLTLGGHFKIIYVSISLLWKKEEYR